MEPQHTAVDRQPRSKLTASAVVSLQKRGSTFFKNLFFLDTTLPSLKPRVGFADHVNPASTLHDLAVTMAILGLFER